MNYFLTLQKQIKHLNIIKMFKCFIYDDEGNHFGYIIERDDENQV